MASDGLNSTGASGVNNGMNSPRIQVSLPTNLKMPPRSPSRESVATEMSVSSSYLSECGWQNKLPAHLSFLKAVPENQQLSAYLTPNRGPSPIPGSGGGRFLRVPGASSVGGRSMDGGLGIGWWEEETDLNVIKNFSTLSKALGLQKSFSTGDIVSLDDSGLPVHNSGGALRACVSEVAMGGIQQQYERMHPVFGMGSRSLSTWVAVGDGAAIQISSQLPSPQGRPTSVHVDASKADAAAFCGGVTFTPADLILNLNKRVRQCYIRRRLLTTYKALERLSQSQFNLDQIAAVAEAASQVDSIQSEQSQQQPFASGDESLSAKAGPGGHSSPLDATWIKSALTLNDVERDQGRPLSKYMRNMMIFNWLHTLEDGPTEML
ncbi:hypothetical protein GHT06_014908 [Daphnia sinensis]|uniref:Uncharacterized protein n=1 Tax=Daphnia sinensis TaxID=1820382 RepID=A0AAD5LA47_9CRUS|nr:hypothetical protein GHT06_014908 [Daphnia sinensis]